MIVRQFCLFFFKQLKIRKWQAEYNSASSYILRSSAKATQTLAITWARITFKMSSSLKLVPASVMETCKCLANNFYLKMLVIDKKNFFFQDEGDNFITRCNKDLPNLPFPPPLPDPTDNPASPTTPCPGGGLTGWFGCLCLCLCLLSGFYFMITMKMNVKINVWRESQFLECTQCYSCGYKQNGTDGEMEEIIDTPFCNGKKI